MEINWNASTRYQDWSNDNFKIVRTMVEQLTAIGIIGIADWKKIGLHGSKKQFNRPENWLNELLDAKLKLKTEFFQVSAGGLYPAIWDFTLLLMLFQNETNMVTGFNAINILFENESFQTPAGSDIMYSTFKKIHSIENTEYAMIHPYLHWRALDDTLTGAYGNPLTFSPMFSGVSWATFLGPGQLESFDIPMIKHIKSYDVDWVDNKGLYMRASQNVADASSKTVESQMIALTEEFRKALID